MCGFRLKLVARRNRPEAKKSGSPNAHQPVAMWLMLALGLLATLYPLAAAEKLNYVDKQKPGPDPCEAAECSSRLPQLSTTATRHLRHIYASVMGFSDDATDEDIKTGINRTVHNPQYTMLPPSGLDNFRSAIEFVVANGVGGDVVELGVWRGGLGMYGRAVLDALGETHRSVHLFDVFDSLSLPGYAGAQNFGTSAQNSVASIRGTFHKYGLFVEGRVHFHEGLFNDTIPSFLRKRVHHRSNGTTLKDGARNKIAVLRLDGNFYMSYQDAMYGLYQLVPVGGVVIFDDVFSHTAVQAFWRDFVKDYRLTEKMIKVKTDDAIGYFIKQRNIEIDWSKYRQPAAMRKFWRF